MVGGGAGSFIGAVHRIAARLDDRWTLVAGALSSDPVRAAQSAEAVHVAPDRAYADFRTMAAAERLRDDRIDAVAVVTPNDSHAAIASAFLEAGFPVICDKPLTTALADAEALAGLVGRTGLPFVLTHNYSGYPMVREARARIAAGELGAIRVVQVEYAQGWLATALENTGQKQAAWRTDPARSGPAGSVGDIGTHAQHLASFVTGLRLEAVAADLARFVPGRRLDDDARMLLRFEGGARGALWCSQVAHGAENGLRLRVYGEAGALEWAQEQPNELVLTRAGQRPSTLTRGAPGLSADAAAASRLPSGHPEGYLEAFARLYAESADLVEAFREGRPLPETSRLLPGIAAGVEGVAFIEAAVASSANDARWTRLARA